MTSQPNQTASAGSPDEDWASITDPNERRKIQNRIAQRKFRKASRKLCPAACDSTLTGLGEKAREQREAAERSAENQRQAAGSYAAAEPNDLDAGGEEGLPWGSISLRHIVSTSRSKEQSSAGTSAHTATSRAGGSPK